MHAETFVAAVASHLSACHLHSERIEAKPTLRGRRARTTRGPTSNLRERTRATDDATPRAIHRVDGVDAWCRSHPRRVRAILADPAADDAASERTRPRVGRTSVEDRRGEARDARAAWARDRREPRVVMLVYPPGLDFPLRPCAARRDRPETARRPCRWRVPRPERSALKVPGAVRSGPSEEIAERAGATSSRSPRARTSRAAMRSFGGAPRRARLAPKRCGEDDSGRGTTREADEKVEHCFSRVDRRRSARRCGRDPIENVDSATTTKAARAAAPRDARRSSCAWTRGAADDSGVPKRRAGQFTSRQHQPARGERAATDNSLTTALSYVNSLA